MAGGCYLADLPDVEATAPAQGGSGHVGLLKTLVLDGRIPALSLMDPQSPLLDNCRLQLLLSEDALLPLSFLATPPRPQFSLLQDGNTQLLKLWFFFHMVAHGCCEMFHFFLLPPSN